jgi:hypothetical protein
MTYKHDPDSTVVLCMAVKYGPSATPAVVMACAK